MTSWNNQFDDLKNQFVARSKERLVVIESLLARLQAAPEDVALLKQTMQHFHWLAGSGGTYGFDDITSWGTYGEELCDYLLKLGTPVTAVDHDKLVTAFHTVEQLFAAQSQIAAARTAEVAPMRNTTELLVPPGSGAIPGSGSGAGATQDGRPGGGISTTGTYNIPQQGTQSNPASGATYNPGSTGNKPSGLHSSLFSTASLSAAGSGSSNPNSASSVSNPGYNTGGNSNQYQTGSYPRPNSMGDSSSTSGTAGSGSENSSSETSSIGSFSGIPPLNPGARDNIRNTSSMPVQTFPGQADRTPMGAAPPLSSGAPPISSSSLGSPPGSMSQSGSNSGSMSAITPPGSSLTTPPGNMSPTGMMAPPSLGQSQSGQMQSVPGQMTQSGSQSGSMPMPGTSQYSAGAFQPGDTKLIGPATSMLPGAAPVEVRRTSRLSHIPTDKKFAIFADRTLSNLSPIKSMLEDRGLLVEGVTTASEAKVLFAERLPDVFIVGAPLIDNNGYELVEFLRGLDAGHKPIVVVLAQEAVFLDKVYAIRSGADAFFEYPSELNDLVEKLHTLLDRDNNENYKILSVEDDPDQANFIKLTLQSAGYTVLHISDPKTFEEHFLSFEPDLVMLDVVLGDMTGFEIAKYIRQNDRFAPLPIVFLTTQNKLHQHIRSAIAGGDEHLIKPVAPQLLIATVASRLERARSLKRLIDRDGLTRCLNFGSFMERAQKLAIGDGYRSAPAMMMIDVDNMKKINEKMGFAAGDRIISNIANMLLKGFRNTDLIARFGNDQFAIVLEHLNPQQLQSLSSQVLGAISGTPQLVKNRSISVTCSGGVAVLEQGMTVQQWLDAAQDSLRKAKDAGGNRAIVKPSTATGR